MSTTLNDYNYSLPPKHIAQTPADPPESCKLLVYNKSAKIIDDRSFYEITNLIDSNTHMFFNNSKVLKARLVFVPTKTQNTDWSITYESDEIELFFLRQLTTHTFEALVRPWKRLKPGTTVWLDTMVSFSIESISRDGRIVTCNSPIFEILEKYWRMPLPPYIQYDSSLEDPYQPVLASKAWSVASPTASLHFGKSLLKKLAEQWVTRHEITLHVWLGTFKPIKEEDITQYDIHSERLEIDSTLFATVASLKISSAPVLAVGTTVTRTLETLPYIWKVLEHENSEFLSCISTNYKAFWIDICAEISYGEAKQIVSNLIVSDTISCESSLFLYPWRPFYVIDQLITNFHLPKSSLLMLVAWYIWFDEMKKIYAHAIEQSYRFYSFWDAMRIV